MLSGYLGASDRFDQALVTFAVDYADQTTRDFDAWLKAIRQGKVQVVEATAAPSKKNPAKRKSKKKPAKKR